MLINCHTYYSLRFGTLSIEQLIALAKDKGHNQLVITDINNSTGVINFVKEANKVGIKAIAGIEFRRANQLLYIGIAKNNKGFLELNRFLSYHNLEKEPLPYNAPNLSQVYFIYTFDKIDLLSSLKENEFIGLRYYEITKLHNIDKSQHHKLIALHPITHSGGESYNLHKHLRAIDNNCLLSQISDKQIAHFSERMPNVQQMKDLYAGATFLLNNAQQLMKRCNINFDFKSIKNKRTYSGSKEGDQHLLRQLAYSGMLYRYGRYNSVAKKRINKELQVISEMKFSAYFLITWDIIKYSMQKGYYHVGRGSGANSIVAYCLRITNVDPIELDLYFERFINPKRSSPPDFDIDYSWQERGDVQSYIFAKYGKEHTALLGTISTFKGKSIYRELGKVYGLPKEEIDSLIKRPQSMDNQHNIAMKIHQLAKQMAGYPNQRSIHAGGILVSEEPITAYTALDLPPKGLPTTQWDMYVAEDIGFEKLDILSQRGIGHIKDSIALIKSNRNLKIDPYQINKFKRDKKVKELLRSGETLGCFYIESPAMRGLIRKLNCDNYLTLVAASSIIRPGVSRSGMMREYINRYNQPNSFKYLHPILEEQLKETYGVMVYQEDVLKICHHFAGLNLAEADVLRRAMSGKTRSKKELNKIANKFFTNCKSRNYHDTITKEVWRQIESFAGYSFSKAHSASYAVESYQSLFLKAHFPLEFITAVINNFGGFYNSWVYFNEARRLGAKVMLPNINHSLYLNKIEGIKLYIGFVHLQNLEQNIAKAIIEERINGGKYLALDNFISRVNINIEQLLILIRAGALHDIEPNKAKLMWEAHSLLNRSSQQRPSEAGGLFPYKSKKYILPALRENVIIDSYDEIELIGFPVSRSYFDLLETKYRGDITAKQLNKNIGRTLKMLGHLVSIKYVKTVHNDYMYFATFLDKEGDLFDSIHFPSSAKTYPFKGDGIYLLLGKIVEEYGYASIEIYKMAKMPIIANPIGS